MWAKSIGTLTLYLYLGWLAHEPVYVTVKGAMRKK